MTDAVIYIRFSTKRQEKGFSKERQLEECQAFCNRKGWDVIQIVEDLGQSAWKGHHLSVGNLGKWRRSVDAGDVPAGKDHDNRRYELIPERVAVLKQIYEWAADGIGYWGIAKRLNDNCVPSWGKGRATTTRKGWGWSYIGILLKHPAVEGEYHPAHVTESGKRRKTGERIENVFPRAVDADLVARARASASKRWQTRSGRYAPYARNLFSTLVRCKHCGGLMAMRGRAKKDGGYSYLQCDSAARHTGCEYSQFFNYRIFERAALDAMLHLALDERFFQREDLSGPLAIRLAELNRAIENKKAEAKRLVRKMAKFDDDDQDEFDEELRAIKREQRELEAERVRVERDLEAARGRLAPNVHLQRVWEVRDALADDADIEAMRDARLKVREAIRNVVDAVWCDPIDKVGDREMRTLTVLLAGGAAGIKFDNEGNTVGTFNFLPELAAGGQSYTLRDGTVVTTNAEALRDALLNRPVIATATEDEIAEADVARHEAAAHLDTALRRGKRNRVA